jgi:nucleoside-diphosphate-sugar epimerase
MKVLLTGPSGNVGRSTLKELLKRKFEITVFDIENSRNKEILENYRKKINIIWGDIRNFTDIQKAVKEHDVIIHTAAIIPPCADEKPDLAYEVNVEGTKNIIKASQKEEKKPKLIFTSSIAIYGDRRKNPLIKTSDMPNPNEKDEYAKQKLKCEELIRKSDLDWVILRLTYIVSVNKIDMDPLMFDMPLETCIEVCHTRDVGYALAETVENQRVNGKILNIGGGENCRIIYRDYIHRMMDIFGLGGDLLPERAFSKKDFHCGFMDTQESERLLQYQHITIQDYFDEVKNNTTFKRLLNRCFPLIIRPIAKKYLLNQSPYCN